MVNQIMRTDALKRNILMSVALLFLLPLLFLTGCESLRASKPIMPIEEYEKMLVGRLDADYVGTNTCLSACHYHDKTRSDFEASTMGAQLSSGSGMPLVNCESCHGPGSLAIKGLTPEKVEADRQAGIQTECDHDTFIDIKGLPPQAQSLMCLKCHTANATFNLHAWNAGAHAAGDVACTDCHDVHAGPDLITSPRDVKDMCFQCHQQVQALFSLRSHHPVREGRVFCNDCHNPHGSASERLLREEKVKETCTKCHGEKEGPFQYEHADLTDDCRACHNGERLPPRGAAALSLPPVPRGAPDIIDGPGRGQGSLLHPVHGLPFSYSRNRPALAKRQGHAYTVRGEL
jgi:DmsE family decaheme c-type cytochrome